MSTAHNRKRRLEVGWGLYLELSDREKCEVSAFVWGALEDQCVRFEVIDPEDVTRILLRAVERISPCAPPKRHEMYPVRL